MAATAGVGGEEGRIEMMAGPASASAPAALTPLPLLVGSGVGAAGAAAAAKSGQHDASTTTLHGVLWPQGGIVPCACRGRRTVL